MSPPSGRIRMNYTHVPDKNYNRNCEDILHINVCNSYRKDENMSNNWEDPWKGYLRLNEYLDGLMLPESQCGSRAGRGTVDMISSQRQLQEKAREHN
ncbi:Hypothetical predicted protein [Octopus vulgaris]|uniref:Uncharacterized protein n=1 Tax=Octopus vulgaris TaxID=6645 RepID=A0AA36BKF2_OCTVU|nr:Hypothetical predicted protein [Octopus vulgaris]